jgi:hypothetical protein
MSKLVDQNKEKASSSIKGIVDYTSDLMSSRFDSAEKEKLKMAKRNVKLILKSDLYLKNRRSNSTTGERSAVSNVSHANSLIKSKIGIDDRERLSILLAKQRSAPNTNRDSAMLASSKLYKFARGSSSLNRYEAETHKYPIERKTEKKRNENEEEKEMRRKERLSNRSRSLCISENKRNEQHKHRYSELRPRLGENRVKNTQFEMGKEALKSSSTRTNDSLRISHDFISTQMKQTTKSFMASKPMKTQSIATNCDNRLIFSSNEVM